jgi:hypothetical protein
MPNKEKPLYQPWNEDAFMGDTDVQYMDSISSWIYRTLLQKSFFCDTRPYLPLDDEQLWKLAMCPDKKTWLKCKLTVLSAFKEAEIGGVKFLYRKRVIDDWNRLEEIRKINSENGRRGGEATARRSASVRLPRLKQVMEVKECNESEVMQVTEADLKTAVKQIPIVCLKVLGLKAEPWDNVWSEVKDLVEAYGNDKVLDVFIDWAKSNIGETFNGNPVQAFLKIAPGMLMGVISTSTNPEIEDILDIVAMKSDNYLVFNKLELAEVVKMITEYGKKEFLYFFEEFYNKIKNDEYQLRFATKNFVEKGPQILRANRKQKLELDRQNTEIERLKAQVQAEESSRMAASAVSSLVDEELLKDAMETFGIEENPSETDSERFLEAESGN